MRYIFDTVGVQNRRPQFVPHLQENYFKLKALWGSQVVQSIYIHTQTYSLWNFPIDTEKKNDNDGEKELFKEKIL